MTDLRDEGIKGMLGMKVTKLDMVREKRNVVRKRKKGGGGV